MLQSFEITISFCLGKGKEDPAKGRINDVGREHGNEGTKTVKM